MSNIKPVTSRTLQKMKENKEKITMLTAYDFSTAKYIDECGLRGYEIGGAQVSLKHSNFIVNNGYASAKDILDLILHVEKTVFNQFKVILKKEVILVNWE